MSVPAPDDATAVSLAVHSDTDLTRGFYETPGFEPGGPAACEGEEAVYETTPDARSFD